MRNPFNSSSFPSSSSDRQNLFRADSQDSLYSDRKGWCDGFQRHRAKWILVIVSAILTLVGSVGSLAYFFLRVHCSPGHCVPLKVMSLNTWGMPATFGSQYKTERMKAIADEVAKGDYDIYLFQELWMQADYWTIRERVPKGYQMTEFRGLALSTCDGRLAPSFCSGLAVISRFPINETEFNSYTYHGSPSNAISDGEWLARKGVGRVRIYPTDNLSVDIFVTHTAADPDSRYNYTNEWYRKKQVKELVENYIKESDADVIILGGDFNAGPDQKEGSPYDMIRQHMKNCIEEIFYKVNEWLDAKFATYGNLENTFSGKIYDPIIYDYIFYRSKNESRAQVHTNWFELPLFKLKLDDFLDAVSDKMAEESEPEVDSSSTTTTAASTSASPADDSSSRRFKRSTGSSEKLISFSDHEAVTSTIYVRY